MIYRIIGTTDGQYLSREFEAKFPITLGDANFTPDAPPLSLGANKWRFYNSNYSIDAIEV